MDMYQRDKVGRVSNMNGVLTNMKVQMHSTLKILFASDWISVGFPSCNFKVFMDPDAKMFQCPNCSKITCRYCQKDWAGDDHNKCTANQNSSMTAPSGHTFAFPPNWDITSDMDKSYIKVPLKTDAPEYLHVMTEFQRSGGINHTIRNIYRVQNPRLWQKYSLQKSHMLEDLGFDLLNEKHLYHGTNEGAVEKICKEGFDWRLCGIHGTAYGKGTYFALDAAVSCKYSSSRQSSGLFVGNFGASQTLFANTSSASSHSGVGVFGAAETANTPQSSINSSFTFGRPIQGSLSSGFAVGGPSSSGNSNTGFTFGNSNTGFTSGNSNTGFTFGRPIQGSLNSGFAVGGPSSSGNSNTGFTSGNSNTGFTFGNSNIPKGFGFESKLGSSLSGTPSLSSTSNLNLPLPAFDFPVGTSPGGASFQQPSQFIFYAMVLVGQWCRGDYFMKKPPINQNDPHQRPYNSAVDHPNNPGIFVIFDSCQTYPEYLIEFV